MRIGGAPQSLQQGPNVCSSPLVPHEYRGKARGQFRPWALPQIVRRWGGRVARGAGPVGTKIDVYLSQTHFLARGGHADDLAKASIARSYKELNDFDQLTTSSLATALDDVRFSHTQRRGLRY